MEQTIGERMARGAAWLGIGRALTNAIGFCGTVVLVRLLGPGDFGLVAIGASLIALFSGLTNVSPEAALIVNEEPDRALVDTAWTISLIRSAAVSLLLVAIAWPVSVFYGDARLFPLVACLAAIFAVAGLASPRLALRQKQLQFSQDFAVNVVARLVYAAATIAAALYLHSYWALVIGTGLSQVATVVTGYVVAPYLPRPTLARTREILSFTSWITVSQIVATLNFRVDHLLIGATLGTHAVGRYLVSDELSVLPTREVGAPLTAVLFPALAAVASDVTKRRHAYLRVQSILFAVLAPAGVGLGLTAAVVVPLIYGPRWVDTIPLVSVLACVYGLQSFQYAAGPLAMAVGKPAVIARRDVVTLLLRIGSLMLAVSYLGLFGVVVSRAIINIVGVVLSSLAMRDLLDLPLREQLRWCYRTLLSLGIMASVVGCVVHVGAPIASASTGAAIGLAVTTVVAGVLTYMSAHLALWIASGRAQGPERALLDLLSASTLHSRSALVRTALTRLR